MVIERIEQQVEGVTVCHAGDIGDGKIFVGLVATRANMIIPGYG